MNITYNAPVVLSFTLLACIILLLDEFLIPNFTETFFTVQPQMDFLNPVSYFKLASHSLGHVNNVHLTSNLTIILLLGPILEEKYGSSILFYMILITALITGIINTLFFSTGLMGASGIVFMFILLSSLTNFRSGEIPLTFILVAILFLGGEFASSFQVDNVSQFAHILGGICGTLFGYTIVKTKQLT